MQLSRCSVTDEDLNNALIYCGFFVSFYANASPALSTRPFLRLLYYCCSFDRVDHRKRLMTMVMMILNLNGGSHYRKIDNNSNSK